MRPVARNAVAALAVTGAITGAALVAGAVPEPTGTTPVDAVVATRDSAEAAALRAELDALGTDRAQLRRQLAAADHQLAIAKRAAAARSAARRAAAAAAASRARARRLEAARVAETERRPATHTTTGASGAAGASSGDDRNESGEHEEGGHDD